MNLQQALVYVRAEYISAAARFDPFHSNHEGYAIIKEEFEELWEEIKSERPTACSPKIEKEAIQLAAMALRFLIDRC
jgi:hypothetical protein